MTVVNVELLSLKKQLLNTLAHYHSQDGHFLRSTSLRNGTAAAILLRNKLQEVKCQC